MERSGAEWRHWREKTRAAELKKTDPVLSRKFKGNKKQQESPPALKLTHTHRKSNKAREHNREKNNTNQTKQGKKKKNTYRNTADAPTHC